MPNAYDMLKGTHENTSRATKIAILSFVIALMAFIASSVSVYFSYQDSISDEVWQREQIEVLQKIGGSNISNGVILDNINKNIGEPKGTLRNQRGRSCFIALIAFFC